MSSIAVFETPPRLYVTYVCLPVYNMYVRYVINVAISLFVQWNERSANIDNQVRLHLQHTHQYENSQIRFMLSGRYQSNIVVG